MKKHASTFLLGLSIAVLWTALVGVTVHAAQRHLEVQHQSVGQ
jgi:hypothetical protein